MLRLLRAVIVTAMVLGTVARVQAAPPEDTVGRSQLVGCADQDALRTRGIRFVQDEPARPDPALMRVRVFGSVASGRGSSRVWRERAICPGSTLASGDRLRISVLVGRPLYVYVVSTRQDGSAERLYPPEGRSAFVEVDKEVALPQSNEVFELDDITGRESFWIVGSTSRIATDDANLTELLSALGSNHDAPAGTKPSPTAPRDVKVKSLKRPSVLLAAPAEGGMTGAGDGT